MFGRNTKSDMELVKSVVRREDIRRALTHQSDLTAMEKMKLKMESRALRGDAVELLERGMKKKRSR